MHYHTINRVLENLNRAKTAVEDTKHLLPVEAITLRAELEDILSKIEALKESARNARTK